MEFDPDSEGRAQEYIGTTDKLLRLGWGMGGYVYLAPGAQMAVKVHRRIEGYQAEVRAYEIIAKTKLTNLHGLNIPKPRGKNDRLLTFHMDVVSAPYLLDFAGYHFSRPDFPPDTMAGWHNQIEEWFSPNTAIVYQVHDSLRKLGIWYMDFRVSNLKMDGLPGLKIK